MFKRLIFFIVLSIATLETLKAINMKKVDFDNSMKQSKFYTDSRINNPKYKIFKKLYNENFIENCKCENLRIPKIIHQIWLGSKFPEKYKEWQATWLKNHPDWQYILWTDKDIENFNLENKEMFENANNYGEKSDILRYEILYRYGGLYVDTDFECIKPVDYLHYICDFYVGVSFGLNGLNNSLIACSPGCPIMRECIDKLKYNKDIKDILEKTGPGYLQRCFFNIYPIENYKVLPLPVTYFFPLPYYRRFDPPKTLKNWIKDETLGVHHWEVSWFKDNQFLYDSFNIINK